MSISDPSSARQSALLTERRRWHARAVNREADQGKSASAERQITSGLAWFSIALGLAELAAPRTVGRMIGVEVDRSSGVVRAMGLREICSGALILSGRPVAGLWSRVAGDAVDLALLGAASRMPGTDQQRLGMAAASVAGAVALDAYCAAQITSAEAPSQLIGVTRSVTVNRSPADCYRFWQHLENLPHFMEHLESVCMLDERRSRWIAKGPAGTNVQWEAETIEDRPNEVITWRSTGGEVHHWGSVWFEKAPGDRGTIVRVRLHYRPPGGVVGAAVAWLFGEEPRQQLRDDLRRFKQILETGEVTTTHGQTAGAGRGCAGGQGKYDSLARYA